MQVSFLFFYLWNNKKQLKNLVRSVRTPWIIIFNTCALKFYFSLFVQCLNLAICIMLFFWNTYWVQYFLNYSKDTPKLHSIPKEIIFGIWLWYFVDLNFFFNISKVVKYFFAIDICISSRISFFYENSFKIKVAIIKMRILCFVFEARAV